MDLDATLLARIQFGFTVTWHIIFPAFTIGTSAFVTTLLGLHLWTGNERYKRLARYWTKIFAVSFAMGVVSGIVLSYQFGTNWSRFSLVVGNVVGPLIGYEVLTAFFLEATFLGVMLFGWNRVPNWLHFVASLMVALGTFMSAFWILSANSWMQFPTGHEVRDGIAYPVDWLQIVFNPTFPLRLAHMVIAAYLTTSLVVLAVGARHLLANQFVVQSKTMVRMGLGMALILTPTQILVGDFHGQKTAKYQPEKLAAIEGHWPAKEVAPLVLFAWPNEKTESNDFQIAIPHLGSLIITHDWNGIYPGLKAFPPENRPPVAPPFFAFRIMVGMGLLMLGLSVWGGILWIGDRLFESKLWLKAASSAWPLGFVAIVAGWYTTEIGRQPWIANGILRTVDARSPVTGIEVLVSLILFVVVYFFVFGTGILYINRLVNKGPDEGTTQEPSGVPHRPLSVAEGAVRHAAQPGE